jgi:hypothetical protein
MTPLAVSVLIFAAAAVVYLVAKGSKYPATADLAYPFLWTGAVAITLLLVKPF